MGTDIKKQGGGGDTKGSKEKRGGIRVIEGKGRWERGKGGEKVRRQGKKGRKRKGWEYEGRKREMMNMIERYKKK